MRTLVRAIGICAAAMTLGLCATPARAQPGARTGTEALVEELGRVVQAGRAPTMLEETLFVGLRTLRDPRLTPLFASLTDAKLWTARVHGVLGLAEVDPTHEVNTVVVSEIADTNVRATVIAEAIKQDLVDAEGLRELLTISGIEPSLRLVILTKIRSLDGEVTADEVDAAVAALDPKQVGMRVYGMLVAADIRGEDGAAAWELIRAHDDPAESAIRSDAAREAILSIVLHQIRDDSLTHVTAFSDSAVEWARDRGPLELDAIGAMLSQSFERGRAAWGEEWGKATGLSDRIQLAALLTGFAAHGTPEAYDALLNDPDSYVQRLGALGAAIAKGEGFGDQIFDVLDGDHRISSAAAFTAAVAVDPSARSASYVQAMRRVLERRNRNAAPRYSFELARTLAHDDIDAVRTLVAECLAAPDPRLLEVILTAVLENDPMVPWAGDEAPAMPDRRDRALAALITARASLGADLSPEELADLQRIAEGKELLPPAMRVQAAWLALCAKGQEREALARVLAPDVRAKPDPKIAD